MLKTNHKNTVHLLNDSLKLVTITIEKDKSVMIHNYLDSSDLAEPHLCKDFANVGTNKKDITKYLRNTLMIPKEEIEAFHSWLEESNHTYTNREVH